MSKTTKASEIQRAIADDIVRGRRVPGTALDETGLAQEFAVSRTPIREALRQLEMSGLVQARPHRGAVVCDMSPESLDDMFAVMAELEALCARWSAQTMTATERRSLRAMHDASSTLVKGKRRDDYVEANDLFHDTIYDGSHNAFLAETTRNVRLRLAPFRRVQFEGQGRLARSFVEHGRVVAAIERGDAAEAEARMRAHIGVVRDAVDDVTGAPLRRRRMREARAS